MPLSASPYSASGPEAEPSLPSFFFLPLSVFVPPSHCLSQNRLSSVSLLSHLCPLSLSVTVILSEFAPSREQVFLFTSFVRLINVTAGACTTGSGVGRCHQSPLPLKNVGILNTKHATCFFYKHLNSSSLRSPPTQAALHLFRNVLSLTLHLPITFSSFLSICLPALFFFLFLFNFIYLLLSHTTSFSVPPLQSCDESGSKQIVHAAQLGTAT